MDVIDFLLVMSANYKKQLSQLLLKTVMLANIEKKTVMLITIEKNSYLNNY